jgi:hypothetical protein
MTFLNSGAHRIGVRYGFLQRQTAPLSFWIRAYGRAEPRWVKARFGFPQAISNIGHERPMFQILQ